MSAKQPNIIVFLWDNFGWGELGATAAASSAVPQRRESTASLRKASGS